MKTLLIILLLTVPVMGQKRFTKDDFRPFGTHFKTSSAVYWGGVAADFASNSNGREANGFVASNGRIDAKKYFAFAGIGYGLSLLVEKRHPKAASIIRYIGGSVHFGASIYNESR